MEREQLEYEILDVVANIPDHQLTKLKKYLAKPNNKYRKSEVVDPYHSEHDFNLIGKRGLYHGENIKCVHCGIIGVALFAPMAVGIRVRVENSKCTMGILKMLNPNVGRLVVLTGNLDRRFNNPLLKNGSQFTCIPCPSEHFEKYSNHVWIDANIIEEGKHVMLRLLQNEFYFFED